MAMLRQLGSGQRSSRKAKPVRVAAISTDRLVPCLNCGEAMRLSDSDTFECRQCERTVNVDGLLKILEDAGE
jgi:tRNA(Ile2) C34 agmatinyltransferase TiaS